MNRRPVRGLATRSGVAAGVGQGGRHGRVPGWSSVLGWWPASSRPAVGRRSCWPSWRAGDGPGVREPVLVADAYGGIALLMLARGWGEGPEVGGQARQV